MSILIINIISIFFLFKESFQSMRTHIIKKNAHPIYDELFEFSNIDQIIMKIILNFYNINL